MRPTLAPTRRAGDRRAPLALALAATLAAAACDAGVSGPDASTLTREEANALAVEMDRTSGDIVDGQIAQMDPSGASVGTQATRTAEIHFSGTRTCPAGGSVSVEGSIVRELDTEQRTLTVSATATRTMTACAHGGERGTITVDGSVTMTAERQFTDRRPSGEWTTTHKGSLTWTRESGESRTCEIDITSVRNPEQRSRTVTGTVCGIEVRKTVSWS